MPKKRNKNNKIAKPVFHIYCEGEKTEPIYINGYINEYLSEHRNILIVEENDKTTPVQLVELAIKDKKNNPENDIYWVVFDRESVNKYSHVLHLKAKKEAEKNGINIAISNICFEYWLLLHLKYTTAFYENYDDLIKNSELKTLLEKQGLKVKYDKADTQIFDLLKNKIKDAIQNAEKVNNSAISGAEPGKESPCYLNAYTNFHELLIDMKIFILHIEYTEHLNNKNLSTIPQKLEEIKNNIKKYSKSIKILNACERKELIKEMVDNIL